MDRSYILALDQGTTGSRAFLFNKKGDVVSSAYQEFKQYYPKSGWVEHDAQEIWLSCARVINKTIGLAKINVNQIAGIGITNQRETIVAWDRKTSKPLAKAIVWQCRRTNDICLQLKKYKNMIRQKTGLVLDPYFSGTKIQWLLDNVPGLRRKADQGKVCFGTIDSWLIWKLSGGKEHVTDMTNASRTMIFNIRTKRWDKDLLKILRIPSIVLPRVQVSGSVFASSAKGVTMLPEGIPICAVMGDQQAALYGQGCFSAGEIKNTYGTGCFLMLNTGENFVSSKGGLLTTLACDEKGNPVYALEGVVFIAGAAIQWIRDAMGWIRYSQDIEKEIKDLKNTDGVYFVPSFTGLGAPYWDAQARGVICGLTRGTTRREIMRAALESIAYQTKDVFDLMCRETKLKIRQLKVDGGACRNDFLMQFQADILSCKIDRPAMTESTVRGVALLAGVTVGMWDTKKDLRKLSLLERQFIPKMNTPDRQRLYDGWIIAIGRSRSLV